MSPPVQWSPHLININYEDFKSICRTCMLMCDFKFFGDSVVLNIFFKLTDIHFETNDELPQQICLKCFEKINEIHEFTFQCKRTNLKLTKCLNSSKKLQLNEEVNTNIVRSDLEIIEEISTDDVVNDELKLNQIVLNEDDIQQTCEFTDDQNLNFSKDDLKNICRMCMLTCDVKFDLDNVIFDVCYKLTHIQYETKDELPKQICSKCFEKIKEIHKFACVCKQTNSTLMKCLSSHKKLQSNEEVNIDIIRSDLVTTEEISTNDIVNEELKIHENEIPKASKLNQDTHSGDHPYKCDQCSKSFKISINLKAHKRTHSGERPYKCDQCLKTFSQYSTLKNHIRTHSGDRPYKCDQCSKSFKISFNLKAHKRTHSNDRPYKCDLCLKSFKFPVYLSVHMRTHSGARPFKCDLCSKSFNVSSNLRVHMRMHSGERPYKCDQCSKSFKLSNDLKTHIRTHSGERPYKCDQCSKSFLQLSHLKQHKGTHNGERPHKCDQCPKSFVFLFLLRNHMRSHS